jgi:hypothetical protein
MSTASLPSGVKSNCARQCPGTPSGTASAKTYENLPRAALSTGSGLTPEGSDSSGLPTNSTMNLRTPAGLGRPGWPPRPVRVATQRASGEGKGSSALQ